MASLPTRGKSPTRGYRSARLEQRFGFGVLDTTGDGLCGMSSRFLRLDGCYHREMEELAMAV